MQGSDMLATPDTMTLFVVWKDTNRPGPFPGRLLANKELRTRLGGQTCCCFLEAMSEQVNACPVSQGGPAMNPSFRWLYRASTKKLVSFRSYLTPS